MFLDYIFELVSDLESDLRHIHYCSKWPNGLNLEKINLFHSLISVIVGIKVGLSPSEKVSFISVNE